jgi:hypothetical protein
MLFPSVLSHLPRRQCAPCWICRFTADFCADAGGQRGLVLSVVAQIAPALMDQMGADARSRPARRRPELTARAAAPVRAVSPVHHRAGPVRRRGARRRGAGAAPGAPIGAWRRAGPARPGAWVPRPAGGCWHCRFRAGSAPGTGRVAAGLLADGLTFCLTAGIGCARSPTRRAGSSFRSVPLERAYCPVYRAAALGGPRRSRRR